MLHLTPFSLTWDGDRTLFTRLMTAFVTETLPPEGAAQEIARLHQPNHIAQLIRQSNRRNDPCCTLRIMQESACVGLIAYAYTEEKRCAVISALYVEPAHRNQGVGRQAMAMAERQLHRLGARMIVLYPRGKARRFLHLCGYQHNPHNLLQLRKELPVYQSEGSTHLLCYTREALEEAIYAPKLADSVHLALIEKGKCTPLLHNSGVVYAKAVPGDMGVLHPYSLRRPWLTQLPNMQWAIVAERIEVDGSPDPQSAKHVLLFTSPDLIHFTEQPLLPICDPLAQKYFEQRGKCPDLTGLDLPEGCIPGNVIAIDGETASRLRTRFLTPVNVENTIAPEVRASSPADLAALRATARYSDGSAVMKRIDWDMSVIDFSTPGRYPAEGRIHQDHYEFPTMWHKADPAMCRWQGKYYFISTNDLDGNHTLYIRQADTIPGLVTAPQHLILDTQTYEHLGSLLWAPELHIINGKLYIFHAGTPGPFGQEQSHVMALKEGGNPLKASSWELPRRVVRKDGSPLYDKGITLDMTVFRSAGRLYAAWSQRQFDPVDLGAWLYIAELDPDRPWQLLSDPQVLTIPEYGWENNHTFVVEGPFALYRAGRILLTYSGALVDSTYVVGLLSMADGADPLDPASWTKENYPLLTSRSVEGEFGPGHNAYVTDEDGLVWNTYHARPGVKGPRSSGIRRVHFNAENFPVLDMTEEMDLAPEIAWVTTTVIVP